MGHFRGVGPPTHWHPLRHHSPIYLRVLSDMTTHPRPHLRTCVAHSHRTLRVQVIALGAECLRRVLAWLEHRREAATRAAEVAKGGNRRAFSAIEAREEAQRKMEKDSKVRAKEGTSEVSVSVVNSSTRHHPRSPTNPPTYDPHAMDPELPSQPVYHPRSRIA